ncbi:hypothetical protein BC828DRAFT_351593 [Blastocladiella britannica]|nr:hypothetical protein BC828DRAFT_351593 [Blastocladiella britannica]
MSVDELSRALASYRAGVKQPGSTPLQLEFARFLLGSAAPAFPDHAAELRAEAYKMCKKAANASSPEGMFALAECHETGLSSKGIIGPKPDYGKAFSMYHSAAKYGHAESSYRAAVYHENGRGTTKSESRALLFYQKSAALGHPGACYRMGMAELHGELGLAVNARNGIKWLKHAASAATPDHCEGLFELAEVHLHGIEHVVFVDAEYAVKLLREAAALGHVMAMYRLGSYYEHGEHVPRNPATSFMYFKAAAERGHPESMFGVASWYLTGNREAAVPQSDDDAFEWMKKAAEAGLVKSYFALAYLYEEGIGTIEDLAAAKQWYERALAKNDARASQKLQALKRKMVDPEELERRRVAAKKKRAADKAAKEAAEVEAKERERAERRAARRGPPAPTQATAAPTAEERAKAAADAREAREAERERIKRERTGEDACVVM